jgi:hypothetical protein
MELITTDDMVEYIKSRMGYPVTEIEMVVEERGGLGHIHLAIKDTLDWFYRINMDEASYKDIMKIPLRAGIIQYRVPDNIMEVVDVQPSYGNTFSPMMAWDVGPGESLMGVGGAGLGGLGQFDLVTYAGAIRYLNDVKKLVGTQYSIKLHPVDHILRVYPTPKSDRIALATVYVKAKKYEVFANPLFRDMAVARAEMQLGKILKKDDITLPGGAKVNGQAVYSDAKAQWDELFKLLQEQSAQPFMMTDLMS